MTFKEFEWDENKNSSNIAKHGIDFDDAIYIFEDYVLSKVDNRIDYGEIRCIAIGVLDGREIAVVYTLRGSCCRIISARKAHDNEQRAYREAVSLRSED